MSCCVRVDGIVNFSSNNGVIIEDLEAATADPERLVRALKITKRHLRDCLLVAACQGGIGPLAFAGIIDYPDYLVAVAACEHSCSGGCKFPLEPAGR